MLTCIFPSCMCKKPLNSMCHWSTKAAMTMLSPTAENPYRRRNVMRNPKPMKIITCTSWNTTRRERNKDFIWVCTLEFLLNSLNSVTKIFDITVKGFEPATFVLCFIHTCDLLGVNYCVNSSVLAIAKNVYTTHCWTIQSTQKLRKSHFWTVPLTPI